MVTFPPGFDDRFDIAQKSINRTGTKEQQKRVSEALEKLQKSIDKYNLRNNNVINNK